MEISADIVLELWELMVDFVPASKKEDVANKLVMIYINNGGDSDDLNDIKDEDTYLDIAIENYFEEHNDESEDEDYE